MTAFLLAISISCCDTLTMQPEATDTYTFSVLGELHTYPGTDQRIEVYSTSNFNDNDIQDNFVTNAKVFLTDSLSYSSRFRYVSSVYNGKYYGNPERVQFVPGRKYYLRVETASGTIFGETQFPEDFEITSHRNTDTLYIPENQSRELEIRWTKGKGTYGYVVNTSRTLQIENNGIVQDMGGGRTYSTTDNLIRVTMGNSYYGYGRIVKNEEEITIAAYDKNYWAHCFDSQNTAGLKGAYGCFSSRVIKSVRIVIKNPVSK